MRYPETDRMGVAYHAHYLVWFEAGRTELMRSLGLPYREVEERRGIFFPVSRAGVEYRRSARYDERLEIRTQLVGVGASRVRFEYRLVRCEDERLLATGFTEHATVGKEGRPVRLPAELRQALLGAVAPSADPGAGI